MVPILQIPLYHINFIKVITYLSESISVYQKKRFRVFHSVNKQYFIKANLSLTYVFQP